MAEKKRPELDWDDEEVSKVTENQEPEEDSEFSKSDEGLCKVEDPTCEACQ